MKSLVKALLLAVFVAAPCLAQQSPSTVIGDHATVGTNGTQTDGSVNLITRNPGPINFYTDNTKRGSISATGAMSWLSNIGLPNNTYLTARNAANSANVDLIKLDGTDDLFLNSSTGNGIKFANNGTPQLVYDGANNISPVTTNVFSLGTSSLLLSSIFSNTIQIGGATSADVGSHAGYFKSDGNTVPQLALFQGTADTRAATQNFYKSRATDGTGDTIVVSGDKIAQLRFYGANGTSFSEAAAIDVVVDGTPGASNDMPGSIIFRTSPDGSSTVANVLALGADKQATFTGDTKLDTLGKTYRIKTGSNSCAGTFTCNGVTGVVVSTTCASTAGSIVFGPNAISGTAPIGHPYVSAISNGTSFTAKCSVAGETSTYNYMILTSY